MDAIEEGEPFDLEAPFTTARGRQLWVRAKGEPVESRGRVVAVRGALQDVTEQKKSRQELQKAVDALSFVYRFTGGPEIDLRSRAEDVLRFGATIFGVPIGVISRIEGGSYEVRYAHDQGGELEAGMTFDLGRTFCSEAARQMEPMAVHHLGESDLEKHPAYGELKVESYIGAPVKVQGELYGTLAFLGRAPRASAFSEIELSLIRLFAQWLGNELSRFRAVRRLAESEERFQLAVLGSSDGIWDWNLVRDEIFFSPRFKELIGFEEDEFPDEIDAWRDRIHPEDREAADRALRGHLSDRAPYSLEYRVQHRDGEYRWFLARGQAVWGEDGSAIRMAGSLTDITRQKEDRQRLEEALGLQKALLDATPYGIISTDPGGVMRSMNEAAARLLIVDPEDVVDIQTPVTFYLDEELEGYARVTPDLDPDQTKPLDVILDGARSPVVEEREWTLERSDGTTFPAAVSTAPVDGPRGTIAGFVLVFSDMTERKKAERLKNEFVSTVSHELRTPLTSITGALSLLLRGVGGDLGEQAESLVELAHRNSERLILLINDILDMERISAGEMRFEFRVQEIMPLIDQALETNAPYGEKFDVEFELVSGLEGARVDVDAHRFGQVMANLMSNAAKFSPGGGTVELAVERVGPFVRISVTDQGEGIPEEFRERIFEKFSQADGSDVRELGGTGLGLAISKVIVSKMTGRIDFETEPGKGTTFFFDLPEWTSHRLTSGEPPDGARVLVIEDDPEVGEVLMMMLRDQGYDPVVAPDGDAARARLERERFDAITLDLALPDIDGLELLMELRRAEAGRNTPVVVVSATADERRRREKGGADVVDWIQKPIRSADLADALEKSVSAAGGRIRILHVEDDDSLARVVSTSATRDWDFQWAGSVDRARAALGNEAFDVVVGPDRRNPEERGRSGGHRLFGLGALERGGRALRADCGQGA